MKSIIVDNKEKQPWNFSIHGLKQEKAHLPTGDYVIKGLEDVLVIERKKNTGELSLNLGKGKERFEDELIRMQDFKYRYLICEFSINDLNDFPKNSGIPKYLWKKLRMNGQVITDRLIDWCGSYDIELLFCNNKTEAEAKAAEIIKRVLDEYE